MNISTFIFTVAASFSSVYAQGHHGVHYHGSTKMDDHDDHDLFQNVHTRSSQDFRWLRPWESTCKSFHVIRIFVCLKSWKF